MNKLSFAVIRVLIFLFGLIPFRVIYGLSDVIFILVFHLIRYRKRIVFKNLRNAFPEKPDVEIDRIARQFYHHFCDVIVESIKSFSMSEETAVGRYKFVNPEVINQFYDQGKSIICIAGHYNNWEWAGLAAGMQMKHRPVGFYKPLSNKEIDAFLMKTRGYGRIILASIAKTAETFQVYKDDLIAYYMIADQRP